MFINQFLTWENLASYSEFLAIVFMIVEFIKELKIFKSLKTKYLSFMVSFFMLTILNIALNKFKIINIFLYIITAMSISLGANGLSDFNEKVKKKNDKTDL